MRTIFNPLVANREAKFLVSRIITFAEKTKSTGDRRSQADAYIHSVYKAEQKNNLLKSRPVPKLIVRGVVFSFRASDRQPIGVPDDLRLNCSNSKSIDLQFGVQDCG